MIAKSARRIGMSEQPGQPNAQEETILEYATRRGVPRRTVLDWIRRGLLLARRKGSGKTERWMIIEDQMVEQLTTANVEIRKAREAIERATEQSEEMIAATRSITYALHPLHDQKREALRQYAYEVAAKVGTDPAKLFAWIERDNEAAMEWIENHLV
jgi:predicted site-specific integrase-resolvase